MPLQLSALVLTLYNLRNSLSFMISLIPRSFFLCHFHTLSILLPNLGLEYLKVPIYLKGLHEFPRNNFLSNIIYHFVYFFFHLT